jgi:hypothetical protein
MVQATLSDEMEFLKAHTNKLRKVTERYSPDVSSHSHSQAHPPPNSLCIFNQQLSTQPWFPRQQQLCPLNPSPEHGPFSNSYAGRVESQLKLIQQLEAQVKELDPDWGKRKHGPIVTDMYDQDESRH